MTKRLNYSWVSYWCQQLCIIIITATLIPFMPLFCLLSSHFSVFLLPFLCLHMISLSVLRVKSSISSHLQSLFPCLHYLSSSSGVPISPLVRIPILFLVSHTSSHPSAVFLCHRIASLLLAVISLFPSTSPTPHLLNLLSVSIHPGLVKQTESRLWCGSSSWAPWSVYVRLGV